MITNPLITNTSLILAEWDLVSFFKNSQEYVKVAGGAMLSLLGLALLIWGFVKMMGKLKDGDRSQSNWGTIIAMIIIGGAIMAGGIGLAIEIGSGGQKTIKDLGGGVIDYLTILPYLQ